MRKHVIATLLGVALVVNLKAGWVEIKDPETNQIYYVEENDVATSSDGTYVIDDQVLFARNAPFDEGGGHILICPGDGVYCMTRSQQVGNVIYTTYYAKGKGRGNIEIVP